MKLGNYPSAMSLFKHMVKDSKPDDTLTFKVADLEDFTFQIIEEVLKKNKD